MLSNFLNRIQSLFSSSVEPVKGDPQLRNVLIVGAGEAGEMVLREIQNHEGLGRSVIGFVDDDPDKLGTTIQTQFPVLGGTDTVAQICRRHAVDEVIIAMPSAPGSVIRTVTRQADETNADFRIVPGIKEIIEGDVQWNQIRNVQPEDLLGRETVDVDADRLRDYLKDKSVLVTGAAGSIGRHLVRESLKYPVSRTVGIDINESDLYELEASEIPPDHRDRFESRLADIRESKTIRAIVEDVEPELVLHAAALKHVPMSERHPEEVVKTNVLGTYNLLESCVDYNVNDCMVISTDKAVEPENVMGMSKRINELMVSSFQERYSSGRICAVRFGNVLGSRGSVVPLFKKQIQRGGPVTVTDPEVERYFMTPFEAVRLVLTAASFEHRGMLYVLELGDPVRILDLAYQLISLSGYEPETEIPITFTGLREGESMEEELVHSHEELLNTEHKKIQRLNLQQFNEREMNVLNELIQNPQGDGTTIRSQLQKLVR